MSVFEIIMLICFGSAWPFSIYKSYTSRSNGGKSFPFLVIVLAGYGAGFLHKFLNDPDPVIFLYATNATMVLVDMALYVRNRRICRLAPVTLEG